MTPGPQPRISRAAAVACAGLLLLALPAAQALAQATSPASSAALRGSVIRGQVIAESNDTPVERVRVELRLVTGDTVQASYTRHNGEFEFTNVGNAQYVLVVEQKGFEPVRESVDLGSAQRQGVTLFLRKPPLEREEKGFAVSSLELALPRKTRDEFRKGLEQLYKDKDAAGSIRYFERTIADAPGFYEAYYHLGIAAMQNERPGVAEHSLRKCVELVGDDTYSKPFSALASLLSSRNQFAEAEQWARKGIERDANPWQGHYELARALWGLQRIEDCEKSALEALKRKADFAPGYLLLANVHSRLKNYPALLADLNEYLRLDPSGPMSAEAGRMRDQVQKRLSQDTRSSSPK